MKASELRMQNLVEYNGFVMTFNGIIPPHTNKDYYSIGLFDGGGLIEVDLNEVKEIPLTEDWLLKLGFEMDGFGYTFDGWFHLEASSKIVSTGELRGFSWEMRIDEKYIPLHHVHSLQNLYFVLTGEELTINTK